MNPHTCPTHEPGAACHRRHGCRCAGCVREHRRRHKISKAGLATVDATPAREHITRLLAHGWQYPGISRAAGLGIGHASYLHNTARRTHRDVVAAILAIHPTASDDGSAYDSAGTVRRIRALVAIGWPMRDLAKLAGWAASGHLHQVTRRPTVTADTRRRVRDLYERLWDQPGPSPTSAARARAAGWAPPAAWDTDGPHGIDNPDATPVGVRPITTARRYRDRTADDLAEAINAGACLADLEARFNMRPAAIEKALRRAGHADLWNRTRPAEITPRKDAA